MKNRFFHDFSIFGLQNLVPSETFSDSETMDLEQDGLGFLVIFKKIADIIKLYLEFYWESEVKSHIKKYLLLEPDRLRGSNRA